MLILQKLWDQITQEQLMVSLKVNQMSIAFNVNENFSVSYTESEETYDAQDNAATAVADVVQ